MSTDTPVMPVEPDLGGGVHVDTSGWPADIHHVWLTVHAYHDPVRSADVALHPREALKVALRLAVSAVAVWFARRREVTR